jgi:hypothetical protein
VSNISAVSDSVPPWNEILAIFCRLILKVIGASSYVVAVVSGFEIMPQS